MNALFPRLLRIIPCGVLAAGTLLAQTPAPKVKFPQPSPKSTLKQTVGFTDIEVEYSRPGVKGRPVLGKMEPYGVVWRTGANETTKITFSTPVKFGGTEVPAGSYALFSIPDPEEWTVILNRVPKWGAYTYDQSNDVVRAKAKVTRLSHPVETFTIDINDIRDGSATLDLLWENTRVAVPIETDAVAKVTADIDAAMAANAKPDAGLLSRSATFYYDNNLDLKKATQWIDAAIAQRPKSYQLYYSKGWILAKAGDKDGAIAAATKSKELLADDKGPAREEYLRKNQMIIDSVSK